MGREPEQRKAGYKMGRRHQEECWTDVDERSPKPTEMETTEGGLYPKLDAQWLKKKKKKSG